MVPPGWDFGTSLFSLPLSSLPFFFSSLPSPPHSSCLSSFLTASHVDQAGLDLTTQLEMTLLCPSPECWGYRHVLLCAVLQCRESNQRLPSQWESTRPHELCAQLLTLLFPWILMASWWLDGGGRSHGDNCFTFTVPDRETLSGPLYLLIVGG